MVNSRAPYAEDAAKSRGRLHPEPPSASRSAFRRDADRIIHSTAFRRLKHKTQVFVFHEGDHYRTRLTHTIEVTQIGRALARSLGLEEDLAEALALSHDLGHTPFGHTGEDTLDECMAACNASSPAWPNGVWPRSWASATASPRSSSSRKVRQIVRAICATSSEWVSRVR